MKEGDPLPALPISALDGKPYKVHLAPARYIEWPPSEPEPGEGFWYIQFKSFCGIRLWGQAGEDPSTATCKKCIDVVARMDNLKEYFANAQSSPS